MSELTFSAAVVLVGLLVAAVAAPGATEVVVRSVEPACADATSGRVNDVSGTIHQHAIECVAWWGIARGVSDGSYGPGQDVRRDQMATFLARALEQAGVSLLADPPDVFDDDDGTIHELAINQLAALGVVGGVTDRRYAEVGASSPQEPVRLDGPAGVVSAEAAVE